MWVAEDGGPGLYTGLVVLFGVIWFFVVLIGGSYLDDKANGRIWDGGYNNHGGKTYMPKQEVTAVERARLYVWPVTLICLMPLGLWLAIKFIGKFFWDFTHIYRRHA